MEAWNLHPISSTRIVLKLQFWDWGTAGKPVLILMHGSRDHARSWDWVARALRDDYHVYAIDLRGHGNSAWAPGALYSIAEHMLDLTVFADIIKAYPVRIVSHSLGPSCRSIGRARIQKKFHVWSPSKGSAWTAGTTVPPAYQRMRKWVEKVRDVENHPPHPYKTLADAVARMRAVNPFLTAEVAEHLTLHGTNWNAEGSLVWKFDNYTRADLSLWPGSGGSAPGSGTDHLSDAVVLGSSEFLRGIRRPIRRLTRFWGGGS